MKSSKSPYITWHLAGTVFLLATTLMASKLTANRQAEPLAKPLETIDKTIDGFTGTDNARLDQRVLERLMCDSYLSRVYHNSKSEVDLFIAYYAQQRAGESMHSPKHCLPGSGWEIWNYASTDIPVGGSSFKVNKYSISHDTERMVVLYWYQSKSRIIASEYLGKVLLARDAILQNSTAGSIVRVIVPDRPGALEEARGFASKLIPQVQRCFGN